MDDTQLVIAATKIGGYVANRRKSLHTTQADLAALAGVSVRAISALEAGKPTTRLDIVLRVFDALGVDLSDQIETR